MLSSGVPTPDGGSSGMVQTAHSLLTPTAERFTMQRYFNSHPDLSRIFESTPTLRYTVVGPYATDEDTFTSPLRALDRATFLSRTGTLHYVRNTETYDV